MVSGYHPQETLNSTILFRKPRQYKGFLEPAHRRHLTTLGQPKIGIIKRLSKNGGPGAGQREHPGAVAASYFRFPDNGIRGMSQDFSHRLAVIQQVITPFSLQHI